MRPCVGSLKGGRPTRRRGTWSTCASVQLLKDARERRSWWIGEATRCRAWLGVPSLPRLRVVPR
eukprot:4645553-Pyramimonas_sp.AAC.1